MNKRLVTGCPIWIVVLLWFAIAAYGQHYDSLPMYMQIAARNNPLVMQKFYAYRAALEKIPQASSLPDPELSAGIFLSPMELIAGSQVADIRLMQMFPWFGTLKYAKDETAYMARARYESFREAKLEVMYQVQQLWYEIYKIKAAIRITEKNIQILQTLERIALVRFRSGTGTLGSSSGATPRSRESDASSGTPGMYGMSSMQSVSVSGYTSGSSAMPMNQAMTPASSGSQLANLYRIQVDMATLQDNLASLQGRHITLLAAFNSLLNRPPDSPIAITDSLGTDTLSFELIPIADSAIKNNPMLKMWDYELQSNQARKQMIQRMGYPMIGIGISYALINPTKMSSSPMNGKDMVMPMVTVTLPIYRKKYRAMLSESEMMQQAALQSYRASYNELQTSWTQAIQMYLDARRRLSIYTDQQLLLQKTLDIMLQNFAASGSGLTEILLVRQQTLDYELKKIEATANLYTAIAWIRKLSADFDKNN